MLGPCCRPAAEAEGAVTVIRTDNIPGQQGLAEPSLLKTSTKLGVRLPPTVAVRLRSVTRLMHLPGVAGADDFDCLPEAL